MTAEPVTSDDLVGHPDGHVDHNGEKITYEYDAEGNVIGWHKEPTDG